MPADPADRFTSRVADYAQSRPGYPSAAFAWLKDQFGLKAGEHVADIGSGTGLSAAPLLDAGCRVYAVEPNEAMRAAALAWLGNRPGFISVAGRAEATTLPATSVDWVLAAQAFHWFDVPRCRQEFARILRPGGRIVLLWNDLRPDSPLSQGYLDLVRRYAIDFERVCHLNAEADGRIAQLFAPATPLRQTFANCQELDWAGLRGRLLSSSFMPPADHPTAPAMLGELRTLFDRHASGGTVCLEYETRLFVGPCQG